MSLAEQNIHDFSLQVLKDIKEANRPSSSIYLFAAEPEDQAACEHMAAQLDALGSKLALNGTPVLHVNVRDLFERSGSEYVLNEAALKALENDCFHQINLTDEAVLSVHFAHWFSNKGIKLLGMSLPAYKKRILLVTNVTSTEPGKPCSFSWFKAEQMFYLSRMAFFVLPKMMKLVRCMTLPSGTEIDFISNHRAWMTPEEAALDLVVEIEDRHRSRILFTYGDSSELGYPSAVVQAIAFTQALAKHSGRKIRTIQAHEIMKTTACTISSISLKALSLKDHADSEVIYFDLTKMDELTPELQNYTMKVGLPTVMSIIYREGGKVVVLQKAGNGNSPNTAALPGWVIEDPNWTLSSYFFFANDKGNVHEVINNFSKNAEVNFVELSKEGTQNA